jgi:protease IV
MRKSLFLALATCYLTLTAFGQDLGDLVIKEGVGVRALGMGGAFAATANDASAVFFNPAGLAEPGIGYTIGNLDNQQVNNEYGFTAVKLGFLGYVEGKATAKNSDYLSFSALGFGNRVGWLNWGTNYKNQEWQIGGVKNNGWSADIGFLARITPQLRFGIVAQDILTTKDRIVPASLRTGVACKLFDGKVLLAADAELYRSQPNWGHLGLEMNLVKGFTVRGGLDRATPTAGLTLDMAAFSFDYALQFPAGSPNIQRFEAGLKVSLERERPFAFFSPTEFTVIDLTGALKGGLTEYSFLGGFQPGLDTVLEKIRTAEKDSQLDGIILRLGGFSGGLGSEAMVQEIRSALLRFKAKGKKIIAYIEGSAIGDEYYLAAVADKIVAAPGSGIGGFGKSIELYRFGGIFKKFGVDWQILTKGEYKSSFDWLSPLSSKKQQEMLQGIVADLYRQMLTDIAASRKMPVEKIKELGDGMFFPAKLAEKMGLVDKVGFFRDVLTYANELCGEKGEVKLVEPQQLAADDSFFNQVFGVAVIEINGEIVSGYGGQNFLFGGTATGADKIVKDLRQAADDLFVKAIVIRIDSPGGSPIAAGEIVQAIKYAKEKNKTVIASLGGVAASGGYYIAAYADKIVSNPATITGSIGVIGEYPAFAGLLDKLGITTEVVKEGEHSDMFSGLRKFSTLEVMALDRLMDESYRDFINTVVEGRKLPTAEVEKIAQGRVYTGAQALGLKLVDKLGSFAEAIDLAKQEGKIIGEPRLVYYRDVSPWLQFGQGASSALGLPPLFPQYR